MKLKRILALALVVVLALAFCACQSQPANTDTASDADEAVSTDSDLAYIQDKGDMVIGYTLFAPMNYMEGDELVGFETEFATAVCEKLGVTPSFQIINWDTKEMELSSKNIDCIWNGMTITDERKENMSVTNPYMDNRQVLVVKAENAEAYAESVEGLEVVAEAGSAGADLISDDEFFAAAVATEVTDQATALMDVAAGTSDVAVVDYITSIGSTGEGTDYEDLVAIDLDFPGEEYGVAFRKGSDVTAEVNAAIAELIADGTLLEIAEKYGLADVLVTD